MSEDTPKLHIVFFVKAVQDAAKSRLEGRPIFNDKEFVEIKFAGDRNRILVAPADDKSTRDPTTNDWLTYKDRFPEHYKAFQEQREYHGDGTPLSELPFLSASQRASLQALNIYDAETLAALDGAPLQKLGMGARGMKNQAVAYLEKARDTALESRLAEENAQLNQRIDLLMQEIADMKTMQPPSVAEPQSDSLPFKDWNDADLKAFIKDRTGQGVRGNPSHDTLVKRAEGIIAAEKQEAAA